MVSMDKIMNLVKKVLTKEVISYTIFGVLTTLVNFFSFYILVRVFNIEENLSNGIAIVLSILFAYITNSIFVFNSKLNFSEFFKFIIGRAFTFFIEMFGFFVMFNLIHIPDLISKLVITIVVIILNFFISKYFAFKKK